MPIALGASGDPVKLYRAQERDWCREQDPNLHGLALQRILSSLLTEGVDTAETASMLEYLNRELWASVRARIRRQGRAAASEMLSSSDPAGVVKDLMEGADDDLS